MQKCFDGMCPLASEQRCVSSLKQHLCNFNQRQGWTICVLLCATITNFAAWKKLWQNLLKQTTKGEQEVVLAVALNMFNKIDTLILKSVRILEKQLLLFITF